MGSADCPSSLVQFGPVFRSERGDLALAGGRTPLRTVGRLPVYVLCGLRVVEVRTTLAGELSRHSGHEFIEANPECGRICSGRICSWIGKQFLRVWRTPDENVWRSNGDITIAQQGLKVLGHSIRHRVFFGAVLCCCTDQFLLAFRQPYAYFQVRIPP